MANFLAEIIKARDATTEDEFREMLHSVDSQLGSMKTDLLESLQSCFVLYDMDIDRVTSWYVEILTIQEKVAELQKQFYDDQKALQSATDDMDSLSSDLDQCDKNVSILRCLVEVVRSLENADASEYYRASKAVKLATENFKSILDTFAVDEDRDWVKGIRSTINDLNVEIYEKASNEFWSAVHFEKNKLTINRQKCNFEELIQTLVNIGYHARVFNKFRFNLWEDLLSQACSPEFHIEFRGMISSVPAVEELDFGSGDMDSVPVRDRDAQLFPSVPSSKSSVNVVGFGNVVSITAVKASRPVTQVDVIFDRITNILTLVHGIFKVNETVMEEMTFMLAGKVGEELRNKSIKTLILRNPDGDINQAQNNVALMQGFKDHLSNNLNFEFPQGSIFDDLTSNFNMLFIIQVRQDVLVKIRDLIKSKLHDTEEITYPNFNSSKSIPEEIAALHRNPFIFPRCVVSKPVAEIVRVLKDHLRRYPDDVTMPDAALNLYISLVKVPKHESEAGDLVPFCAVMIHNNSYYLAHQACFTFPMCEDKVPELRAKATQAYSFMMRSVRSNLNGMISEAMAGIVNEDASDADVNKLLKISSEFIRLDGLFKAIMPSAILNKTLATLVDHTVNEFCSKVLSWDDISANSANLLSSAFTQFAIETSELFKGDASSPREIEAVTSKCVSKWSRFRSLAFVLTASMKEIEDKWVEGCGPLAADFKAEEVRKLVRALFQNTDRRAAFLSSVR